MVDAQPTRADRQRRANINLDMSATVRANGLDIHYVSRRAGTAAAACSTGRPPWAPTTGAPSGRCCALTSRSTCPTRAATGAPSSTCARAGRARCWSTMRWPSLMPWQLERFHIMALSMGARTAVELAARHPERVLSMLVIAPALRPEPAASVARRRLDPEAILRDDPAWAGELAVRHDSYQGAGAWQRLAAAIRDDSQQLTEVSARGAAAHPPAGHARLWRQRPVDAPRRGGPRQAPAARG